MASSPEEFFEHDSAHAVDALLDQNLTLVRTGIARAFGHETLRQRTGLQACGAPAGIWTAGSQPAS